MTHLVVHVFSIFDDLLNVICNLVPVMYGSNNNKCTIYLASDHDHEGASSQTKTIHGQHMKEQEDNTTDIKTNIKDAK